MKMTVVITEELERVVEVEVPDTLTEEEAEKEALEQVQNQYRKSEIILDSEDYLRTFWYVGKDFDEATESAVDEWSR